MKPRLVIATLLVVSLLAAACGGSDGAAGDGGGDVSTTEAGGEPGYASLADLTFPDPSVSFLQQALSELGYHTGPVDGIFGPATTGALASFQDEQGLEATGHLDGDTIEALERANEHVEHLLVEAIQTQLTEVGHYSGAIDGLWGSDSELALIGFQESAGLEPTGMLDDGTYVALVTTYDRDVIGTHRDAASAAGVGGDVHDTRSTVPEGEDHGYLRQGDEGPEVEQLQLRLAELGYRPGTPDGSFGAQTASAVLAFQKREGLVRDQLVGPEVLERLDAPQGAGPRSDAPGPRIEVDLDRQILFAIAADGTVTTINTSTGSGKEFQSAEPGKGIVVAHTPVGEFSIVRVVDANEQAPLGTLYRPMYFTWEGGFAIHGNPNVPAYPASHGCARTANWDQDFLWESGFAVGDGVWVYGQNPPLPDNAAGGF